MPLLRPWALTFSYGRALQHTVLVTWKGQKDNIKAAQAELLKRAKANGEAAVGKYTGWAASAGGGGESLFVADHKY
jgi:fructose-bisphosphate aldolase class I